MCKGPEVGVEVRKTSTGFGMKDLRDQVRGFDCIVVAMRSHWSVYVCVCTGVLLFLLEMFKPKSGGYDIRNCMCLHPLSRHQPFANPVSSIPFTFLVERLDVFFSPSVPASFPFKKKKIFSLKYNKYGKVHKS